jgi:hypothetical protein
MTEADAEALAETLEAVQLRPQKALPPLPKPRTGPRATPSPYGSSPRMERPRVLAPSKLVFPPELSEPPVEHTVPQERYELDELTRSEPSTPASDRPLTASVPTIAAGARQRESHVARVWFEQGREIEEQEVAYPDLAARTRKRDRSRIALMVIGGLAAIAGVTFFALALGARDETSPEKAAPAAAPSTAKTTSPAAAPAPVIAPARPTANVSFRSVPSGARVTLISRGQPTVIGTAPTVRSLSTDHGYEVVFSHPGYRSKLVRVGKGARGVVKVELTRARR